MRHTAVDHCAARDTDAGLARALKKAPKGSMQNMEDHLAAMAARMIDAELASIIRRLPAHKEQAPFHLAVLKEAERRGLLNPASDNQTSSDRPA
jgi:hypothetical protein